MKPHQPLAFFVLSIAAWIAAGAVPSAARIETCQHADVLFYTTDTTRLATEVSKATSSCADYYFSITPTATGAPRGGAPITALRALGPQFHALAEIRVNAWQPYADTNGWYAAGVEARREMTAAGYDASLGDTWAVNEVGAPSGTQLGVDVLANVDGARQDLRDFVRGLYAGDGSAPSRGLVFAADPLQVTADLSQYKLELRAWYTDAPFWNDMRRYVRFWAQETYADARAWGVAGSTLSQRSAYLDDYFLHGSRLAAGSGSSTQAARLFFAGAYAPLGNAAYRSPAPDPSTGIGFGSTDVDLGTMESFVSSETYALRSSAAQRFGFAFVPTSATATETLAVADRVAAAVQGSETGAAGACGPAGEWCGGSVDGAEFNDAWKTFANTLEGSAVTVRLDRRVTVTYATVTSRGATQLTTVPLPRRAPKRLTARPGARAYLIETTASYTGQLRLCIAYDAASNRGYSPKLFHLVGRSWIDVSTPSAPRTVCGKSRSLGTFAVFTAPHRKR